MTETVNTWGRVQIGQWCLTAVGDCECGREVDPLASVTGRCECGRDVLAVVATTATQRPASTRVGWVVDVRRPGGNWTVAASGEVASTATAKHQAEAAVKLILRTESAQMR